MDPSTIVVVSDSWYPRYSVGATADTVRGRCALRTLYAAVHRGHQVVVVDGGSSIEFMAAVPPQLHLYPQEEPGMSAGRQQGYRLALKRPDARVIARLELEKTSLVTDGGIDICAEPILRGTADIVIPARTEAAWNSYPPFQADSERAANERYNGILRKEGIIPAEHAGFDWFFGPRFFSSRVADLFQRRYAAQAGASPITRPDRYSNAVFFPPVLALTQALDVISIEVPYTHPPEQTAFETGRPDFDAKRIEQANSIVHELVEFIRLLRQKESQLREVPT